MKTQNDHIDKMYEDGKECLDMILCILNDWPIGEYSRRIDFEIRTADQQQMILKTIKTFERWVKALALHRALYDRHRLDELSEKIKFVLTKEDYKEPAIEDAEGVRKELLSLVTSLRIASRVDSKSTRIDQPEIEKNTAFIIMAIGQRAHIQDTCNTIKRVCKLHGFHAFRADDFQHGGIIVDRIHEWITVSEILIADLTLNRPNVYYEIGVAKGKAKEPILFRRKGTKLPFDLAAYNVPEYRSYAELESLLANRLKALSRN